MKPRLPSAIYAIGATSLLNDASSEMIFPLLPVFLSSVLGAGAATLGVIEGTADAAASLLKLASGALSDRMDDASHWWWEATRSPRWFGP